ncbi:LysR substrate-binding domain-containing protein, partial [Micrococcus sp. SIMBA_131]
MTGFAERYPQVDVVLRHGTSRSVAEEIRSGGLDAGFYNETDRPGDELNVVDVSRFAIYLAVPPG